MICHLAHMCKDATVVARVTIEDAPATDKNVIETNHVQSKEVDEQSKMLCNVIVQATHELHVNAKKNRDEIQEFLKNDCQKLATAELVGKVRFILEMREAG